MPKLATSNDNDLQRSFVVIRRDAQGVDENPSSLVGDEATREKEPDTTPLGNPAVARFIDSQNDFSVNPGSRNYINPLIRSRQELFGVGSRCEEPQICDLHAESVNALYNSASNTLDC